MMSAGTLAIMIQQFIISTENSLEFIFIAVVLPVPHKGFGIYVFCKDS